MLLVFLKRDLFIPFSGIFFCLVEEEEEEVGRNGSRVQNATKSKKKGIQNREKKYKQKVVGLQGHLHLVGIVRRQVPIYTDGCLYNCFLFFPLEILVPWHIHNIE